MAETKAEVFRQKAAEAIALARKALDDNNPVIAERWTKIAEHWFDLATYADMPENDDDRSKRPPVH